MEIKRAGRFAVPAKVRRVPRYFIGLPTEIPDEVEFPGLGRLRHFNVATRKGGEDIRSALVQSLDTLPEGISTVVLLGSDTNPMRSGQIAVFVDP